MHIIDIKRAGKDLKQAEKVLIMIHGRGAKASDMLELAPHFNLDGFALIAPQASNSTWYPYSFIAATEKNEPWLSSALNMLSGIIQEISDQGIPMEKVYFLGFSQGACLTLEFTARHADRFGGVVAFTGGLVGDSLDKNKYVGDFETTPIFISTGNPDTHVPLSRVNESVEILEKMNASVKLKVYENRPHTISKDEIEQAREWVFNNKK